MGREGKREGRIEGGREAKSEARRERRRKLGRAKEESGEEGQLFIAIICDYSRSLAQAHDFVSFVEDRGVAFYYESALPFTSTVSEMQPQFVP